MLSDNGGLTAPSKPAMGLGQAAPPRRVAPARRTRRRAIQRAVAARQQEVQTSRPRPAAVASQEVPGLGRQLTRRVNAGAIGQDQAQQVARDRALLEAAYGPDWRVQLFGDRGYMQRTRASLAENPEDPQVAALYKQLMGRRSTLLSRAREMAKTRGASPGARG